MEKTKTNVGAILQKNELKITFKIDRIDLKHFSKEQILNWIDKETKSALIFAEKEIKRGN